MPEQQGRELIYIPTEVSTLVLGAVEERKANPGAGIRLGLPDVDRQMLPLRPGELVTVTGRPGNYKSGLMQYWARRVAGELVEADDQQGIVVYVTWEMAIEEIGLYDLAAGAALNAAEVAQGRLDDAAFERLRAAAMKRACLPLWLIGHSIERRKKRPRLTLSNVGRALMWIEEHMEFKPRIVFLDYLQQMEPERRSGQEINRRMDIFENVHRCKDMALALGCPVVLGVQAGRQVDGRDWKLPQLGDQMESANVEHTADKMLSVWMPKTSEEHGWPLGKTGLVVSDNLLILGLVKQKLGPAGGWWSLYVDPARNIIGGLERGERHA
jgi:replicative DNA helicase